MADANRTGRTVPAGGRTGRTLVPGQAPDGPGLDKMLEVVGSAPDPSAPHAFLLVISGSDPGRLHILDRPELVIGRSKYADLRISERAMSQQHAKLVRVGDQHRLYDLGSTNGTFVNDERVTQADLKVGDVVRTGETVFTYMSATPGEPSQGEDTLALPAASTVRPARAGSVGGGALVPVTKYPAVRAPGQIPPAVITDSGVPAEPDFLTHIIRVMGFFRRYWLSIALIGLLGSAAGVASYQFMRPAATAEFEINLMSVASDNPVERGRRENFGFFRTAKENFLRPALIHATLEEMGETDITPGRVNSVQRSLEFKQHRNQITWEGSFDAETAEEARQFLDAHLEVFVDSEIEKTLQVLSVEVGTLEAKLGEAEDELQATEQAILAFKQENTEGLPDQAQQFYQELIGLGTDRGRAASEVARTATEVKLSRRRLKSEAPLIESRIEMARPYEETISDVKRQIASAKASGKGTQHPEIVALKAQLKSLEKLRDDVMANGTTSVVRSKNPIYESARRAVDDAEAAHKIAQSELGRLTNDMKRTEKIVRELPGLQAEFSELSRSYEATQAIHNNLFEKVTSSRIQLEMERGQASARYDIVVPPNVRAESPTLTMIKRGAAGTFLGLLFGIGLGMLRDLRRMIAARLAQEP